MPNSPVVTQNPEQLAVRLAQDFVSRVQSALASQPRFSWVLAGGVTPRLFYSRLVESPYRDQIPWEKLWIYWGDERCVPPEHPDSNFRMAQEALLSKVPVKPSQVFRLRGEDPPPKAAKEYETILRSRFPGADWPAFDLVLLGMGADGHIASIMPGTAALSDNSLLLLEERRGDPGKSTDPPRWVVHNVVRQLQTVRLTLTLPAINRARDVWFIVTGNKKAAAYRRAQEDPGPDCPASLVRPESGTLRWYVDQSVMQS